ncbi:MAG: hypothetical protein OSA11_00435 [Candidatus Nanopelagicales bacterium]|nr:hypothetical protein [Candidatus Nanopelagicales bacterium]
MSETQSSLEVVQNASLRSQGTWSAFVPSLVFSLFSAWTLLRLPGNINPFSNVFRGYFSSDQLSYAGIAASAKAGQIGLVEPFTQTGSSFYPSWWYKFIGLFAGATGLEVPAAWSILGFSMVLGSIVFISCAAWRLSGKPWAPIVIGLLLWVGPLASILFDTWLVNLNSHAVLWGPYGALYALNGEAAGLTLGSSALILGYWVVSRPAWPRLARFTCLGLSGLILGVVANFQTYSFLTLTAVTLWIIAVGGLLKAKSRKLLIISAVLLTFALIGGTLIRETVGALPVYALMLISTLPGIWAFARLCLPLAATGFVFFVIGAAPQVIWLILGTLDKDPFLTYRVDQSGDLGIPIWAFIVFGSPVLFAWVAILRVQIIRKGTKEIALLVGWFVAFVLLSFNDSWAFSQEPYRFWITSVIIFVFIAALTFPSAETSAYFSSKGTRILSVVAIVLIAASFWNVGGFRSYVSSKNVKDINFNSTQLQAISQLVSENTPAEGLLTVEPCMDPLHVKVVTGVPVAYYNLGLAWPENKAEIDAVFKAGEAGVLDINLMQSAGVSYLLTDSNCPTAWGSSMKMGVSEVDRINYLVKDTRHLTLLERLNLNLSNRVSARQLILWKIF